MARGLMLLVLTGVAEEWRDHGDGTCGGALHGVHHDELLHDPLVDRLGVGLHHEGVGTTDGLGVTHVHLAVGEIVCGGLKYVGSQVFCGFLSLLGVRATRHQSQFLIRSAFENRRHACLPNCSICENKPNSNITMRVPTARGRCGSVSPYRSKLPSATSKNPQTIDAEGTYQRQWFGENQITGCRTIRQTRTIRRTRTPRGSAPRCRRTPAHRSRWPRTPKRTRRVRRLRTAPVRMPGRPARCP